MNTGLAAANPSDGADKPTSLVEINKQNEVDCRQQWENNKKFDGVLWGRYVDKENDEIDKCIHRRTNAARGDKELDITNQANKNNFENNNKVLDMNWKISIFDVLAGLVTSVLSAFLTVLMLGRNKPASVDISKNKDDKKKALADQEAEKRKLKETYETMMDNSGQLEEIEFILADLDLEKSIDDYELKELAKKKSELERDINSLNTSFINMARNLKPMVSSQIKKKTKELEDLEKQMSNLKNEKKIKDDKIRKLNLLKININTANKKLDHDTKLSTSLVAAKVKTVADLEATISQQHKLLGEIEGNQIQELIGLLPTTGEALREVAQSTKENLNAKSVSFAKFTTETLATRKARLAILQTLDTGEFDARQDANNFAYSKNTVPIAAAAGAAASGALIVGTYGAGVTVTPAIMGAAIAAGQGVSTAALKAREKGLRGKGDPHATAAVEQGKALIGAVGDVAQTTNSIWEAKQKEKKNNSQDTPQTSGASTFNIMKKIPDFMNMTSAEIEHLGSVTQKSSDIARTFDSVDKKDEEMKIKKAKETAAEKKRQEVAEKQKQEESKRRERENLLKKADQMRKEAEAAAAAKAETAAAAAAAAAAADKVEAPAVAPKKTGRKLAKPPSSDKEVEEGEIEAESRPRGRV
jgi:hypothetical protein